MSQLIIERTPPGLDACCSLYIENTESWTTYANNFQIGASLRKNQNRANQIQRITTIKRCTDRLQNVSLNIHRTDHPSQHSPIFRHLYIWWKPPDVDGCCENMTGIICRRQNPEALMMFRAERIPDRAAICGWKGVLARGMYYRRYDRGRITYMELHGKEEKNLRMREDVTKDLDGLQLTSILSRSYFIAYAIGLLETRSRKLAYSWGILTCYVITLVWWSMKVSVSSSSNIGMPRESCSDFLPPQFQRLLRYVHSHPQSDAHK